MCLEYRWSFCLSPTVIGVAVKPLHPSAVAVKFRLAGAWKSSDGGLKTYPDRLGVARYTVPVVKPVWVQKPEIGRAHVCTPVTSRARMLYAAGTQQSAPHP